MSQFEPPPNTVTNTDLNTDPNTDPNTHTNTTASASSSTNPPKDVEQCPSDTPSNLTFDDAELAGLPRLRYNLRDHKKSLAFWVPLLVIESSLLPIAFFYGLWYGTDLRHGILFAIITACFGLVTGIEFGLRCLKLILKRDTYRPLSVPRWHFDLTHWTLSCSYTLMTAILIGASVPEPPLTRPLAMPASLFFIQVGGQMVYSAVMCHFGKAAPFRISSVRKGEPFPPMVLTVLEDIVGVDGGGGKVYRRAVLDRYAKSEMFRDMIIRLNWFWGVPGLVVGIGTLIGVWLVPMEEIAYGFGWGIPFIWVCIWVPITIRRVLRGLRLEKQMWAETHR